MAVNLTISWEPLGEETSYGHWCDVCLLPSAARLRFVVTIGSVMELRTLQHCPECGLSGWVVG